MRVEVCSVRVEVCSVRAEVGLHTASCVRSQDNTGSVRHCGEQHNGCVLVMKNYCCYPHGNNIGSFE